MSVTVHETQKRWELQEAHLNSLMLPDWENMERLLGTDAHRLFLDFPFPRRKSGVKQGPDQWFKMRWFWWMQRSFVTSPSHAAAQHCRWWLAFSLCVSVCMCCASLCDGRWIYSLVTTLELCSRELWEFYVFKNKRHEAKARIMSSWISLPKTTIVILKLSSSSHVSCQTMTIDDQEPICSAQQMAQACATKHTCMHARPHKHTQPIIVSQRTMIGWFLCM